MEALSEILSKSFCVIEDRRKEEENVKITKYSNLNRRRKIIRNVTPVYREQIENQLYQLLAKCETEEQRNALIDAYNITLNPERR